MILHKYERSNWVELGGAKEKEKEKKKKRKKGEGRSQRKFPLFGRGSQCV